MQDERSLRLALRQDEEVLGTLQDSAYLDCRSEPNLVPSASLALARSAWYGSIGGLPSKRMMNTLSPLPLFWATKIDSGRHSSTQPA